LPKNGIYNIENLKLVNAAPGKAYLLIFEFKESLKNPLLGTKSLQTSVGMASKSFLVLTFGVNENQTLQILSSANQTCAPSYEGRLCNLCS
jgi:hypothetical protein